MKLTFIGADESVLNGLVEQAKAFFETPDDVEFEAILASETDKIKNLSALYGEDIADMPTHVLIITNADNQMVGYTGVSDENLFITIDAYYKEYVAEAQTETVEGAPSPLQADMPPKPKENLEAVKSGGFINSITGNVPKDAKTGETIDPYKEQAWIGIVVSVFFIGITSFLCYNLWQNTHRVWSWVIGGLFIPFSLVVFVHSIIVMVRK